MGALLYVILGIVGWLALVSLAHLIHHERWKKCEHGVTGGQTRRRCQLCEQKKLDEERRREEQRLSAEAARLIREEQTQFELRQRRLAEQADALRREEATRLSKEIIPSLKELQSISPYAFEDCIAQMFERLGFEVEQTAYSGDAGRDGILKKEGKKFLYECKRYGDKTKVGRPEIQKFHSALVFDRGSPATLLRQALSR